MLNERRSEQRFRRVSGFTAIELLVGLTVGAIVLLTLALSWSLAVRDQVYILSVTSLNNDMRSLMQIITQDARRAIAPQKNDLNPNQLFVELARTDGLAVSNASPADCVVFNAHIGAEDIGPETDLRFVWSLDGEGPTLVPSGFRLKAGQFEIWAPPQPFRDLNADPPQPGTALSDGMTDANYQGFGKCDEDTPTPPGSDTDNWWTPLIVDGDRGVFLDRFEVRTMDPSNISVGSRCLSLAQDSTTGAFTDPYPVQPNDRCPENATNSVEVLSLFFELAGRIRVVNLDRNFVFRDSVKVRNDWIIRPTAF